MFKNLPISKQRKKNDQTKNSNAPPPTPKKIVLPRGSKIIKARLVKNDKASCPP